MSRVAMVRNHGMRVAASAVVMVAVAGLTATTTTATATTAAATSGGVTVRDNFFDPSEVHIAPGDTVTWTWVDGGHTVTADRCRSDPNGAACFDSGERARTSTFAQTFPASGVYGFFCKIHGAPGSGMSGRIVVGDPPPPPPPPDPLRRTVPTAAFPTIGAALEGAPDGTTVAVAPGVYRESVVVTRPGVTIAGTGAGPGDVVLDGETTRDTGIGVGAGMVTIMNLTVRRFTHSGFDVVGAAQVTLSAVGAGANGIGVLARNSDALTVRNSIVENNAAGVVILDDRPNVTAVGVSTTIEGSRIERNSRAKSLGRLIARTFSARSGLGIWVDGGHHVRITRNIVTDHDAFGIVVTGLGAPAFDVRVDGNVAGQSGASDLAWDGLGSGVCFAGNTFTAASPPLIETIAPCATPAPAGVPYPLVDAIVLDLG